MRLIRSAARRNAAMALMCGAVLTWSAVALSAASTVTDTPLSASLSPYDVGERCQLFVDRVLVGDLRGISFTMHPAKKAPQNPLIVCDQPWEGWRLCLCGDVIFDPKDKLFKIWYLADFSDGSRHVAEKYVTCYARSRDGIHWEKPRLDVMPMSDGTPTNIVCAFGVGGIRLDEETTDTTRRFKMVFYDTERHGYHTAASPDGIHWRPLSSQPIIRGRDVICCYYDARRSQYVALAKIMTPSRGFERRVFYLSTSDDFEHWSQPTKVLDTDLRDDASSLQRIEQVRPLLDMPDNPALVRTELYGFSFYPQEATTVVFPWILTVNNNGRYGNQEGPGELQIGASRDLVNWERHFRAPSVPRGKVGEWDSGWFWGANTAIRVGDEIRLYFGAGNTTHGTPCLYRAKDPATGEDYGRKKRYTSSIGLATWKLDRFVSADAPAEGGRLTTIPVSHKGNRLELNAATKSDGRIVVLVHDLAGGLIAKSKPVRGDDVRLRVEWETGTDVAAWAGRPVVLTFEMENAELYSFAFRR